MLGLAHSQILQLYLLPIAAALHFQCCVLIITQMTPAETVQPGSYSYNVDAACMSLQVS